MMFFLSTVIADLIRDLLIALDTFSAHRRWRMLLRHDGINESINARN